MSSWISNTILLNVRGGDIAVSLKFPPDFSVDFPWFLLRTSRDSPKIIHCFISYKSTKNPYKFCRESPGIPWRISMENSPRFPRGFSFHLQPKFPRGFPSTKHLHRRIRVILPVGVTIVELHNCLSSVYACFICQRQQQNNTEQQEHVFYQHALSNFTYIICLAIF